MKRAFALICVLLFIPLIAWGAPQQVDPADFGQLVKVVKQQDQDIDKLTRIVQGMDKAISALQNRPQGPTQPGQGGSGGQGGGTYIYNAVDSQARKTANRALAWAIYSQIVDKNGKKPDIEDVERMLTPLEKGDMTPYAFEVGLVASLKAHGWKLIEPSTPLCPDQIKKICEEAIVRTLKELQEKVSKLETELAEVRKIAEGAKQAADKAQGLAQTASDTATAASDTATKALTTATGIQIPAVDMAKVTAEAKATAETTVASKIPDMENYVTKANLNENTKCLENKIAAAKADSEATDQALARTFTTNNNDEKRAIMYAGLMIKYQNRGYKGDSVHGMVQVYLRSCYWTECLIEKAAKANGGRLVPVDQIKPLTPDPK